jgi:DNA-binding response OmpR family regulator
VRRQARDAEFSVRDEGRGIPPEHLEAIFERFRQVDASDRREKGGTGLGLAIAREIVERSRGRIWAESEPGAGATFRFTLPLAHAGLAIAICDRREEARQSLADRLTQLGLRAVPVADADALGQAAAVEPIAAVVLLLGPATAAAAAALDADARTATIPRVLLERPDEPGVLSALEAGVPALRTGRVLVVEDDPDMARLLVRGIERRGFDVELARTGRDARAAIERAAPGLLVLDVKLPGEDGFAVVDWLRRTGRLAAVPLLVYTARSIGAAERDRLQLGHTEFLEKSEVEPAEVARRVAELLGCLAEAGP